ncbi:MAG: hypothetical protein CVU71_13895 [Deltaproteobacteria bacterium HGW-Deltaproteobacteria-6]|jgi:hypothetical protein|nr:MAG: hypothetical protein CVU71_13895 [Deltaproteobacteria bacterium HGW-Deltaproteobacteria-6]
MRLKLTAIMAITLTLFLSPPAEANNIFKAGRDITITEEQTVDNVVSVGGQITVNGLVEQTVLAVAGSVVLTNKAVVRGNVIVIGGVVARGSGSMVFGDITEINSSTLSSSIASALRGESEGWALILSVISLCFFAIILIIALMMTLLIPRSLAVIGNAIQTNMLKSFLWGFLVTLMIVPFFMLLAISIIGIFLIPLAFTALLLAAIIGFIAFGSLLGNFVITKIFPGYKKSLIKETLVGLSLLWLLGWIPFYIGMVIKVLAITFGLGGVLLALSRRKARQ